MSDEKENIVNVCKQMCESKNFQLIFLCESGSRSWGYSLPDSDYDIRGIYVKSRDDYMYAHFGKDNDSGVIEKKINDYDISLWDVRKVIDLYFRNGNQMPIWWVCSDIVYFENDKGRSLKTFLLEKNLNNYNRIASQYFGIIMEKTKNPTLKGYIFAWRSILCANHLIETRSTPPQNIKELLDRNSDKRIDKVVNNLLVLRQQNRDSPFLDDGNLLNEYIDKIKAFILTSHRIQFNFDDTWKRLIDHMLEE